MTKKRLPGSESSSAIVIRRYRAADERAVVEAMKSDMPDFFHPSELPWMRSYLKQKGNPNFVICEGGKVLGFGGYAIDAYSNRAYLCWGHLTRVAHGRGLGSVLLLHRLVHLTEAKNRPRYVAMNTIPTVAPFFERHGFVRYGEWKDGFRSGFDMVELMLDCERVSPARLRKEYARALKRAAARAKG